MAHDQVALGACLQQVGMALQKVAGRVEATRHQVVEPAGDIVGGACEQAFGVAHDG